MNISIRYIELKYGKASNADWVELMKAAGSEIESIKSEKSDIFNRFPGVHGRFQQSQLDVLDIREQKACAIFDNAMNEVNRAL